jgi:hypothetical protein
VVNNSGTLLGFVPASTTCPIFLNDKSTAAGVWSIAGSELVGASAQLLTTSLTAITTAAGGCISLGGGREIIIGNNSTTSLVAVVYDASTNTFGSVTTVRTANVTSNLYAACLVSTDKVLVVSCANGAATFEAVVLSISGTTISVGTAATATLSANINVFADGCGLIAVGSDFVTSYSISGPAAQIRAISVSGTTATIGSASVLDGTAGGLVMASGSIVIAASTATTNLYTKPYTVSGSTLSGGTGTTTSSGTMTLNKMAALGSRWVVLYNDGGSTVRGGVVSLSGTTTTISAATLFAAGTLQDAIVVSSSKVLTLNNQATSNANILTDSAGTASAGTAITLSSETARKCMYVSSTDVCVWDGASGAVIKVHKVSCSGASPVLTSTIAVATSTSQVAGAAASNSMLVRGASILYSNDFAYGYVRNHSQTSGAADMSIKAFVPNLYTPKIPGLGTNLANGKSSSENWLSDAATMINKVECAA